MSIATDRDLPGSTRPTLRIGFVGIGIMGGAMSMNLLKAGYELTVHDLRPEAASQQIAAGAIWGETPARLAAQSDIVFTCLPNLEAIRAVFLGPDGLLQGLAPGGACLECSTNTPELLRELYEACAAKGIQFLDAPISGGAPGAKRGRMAFWVGGDCETYLRCEPVLRAMGDKPKYVGKVGSGLVTKLVHNGISQTTQAAIAEMFVMGVKAGADPLLLWAAIRQGVVGRRRTFDGLGDQFLPARYDPPQATLAIVEKDLKAATALGRELNVPLRFANLALADIMEAMNRGWEGRDARAVMLLPQERAGVRIEVAADRVAEVLREDPPAPGDAKHGNAS